MRVQDISGGVSVTARTPEELARLLRAGDIAGSWAIEAAAELADAIYGLSGAIAPYRAALLVAERVAERVAADQDGSGLPYPMLPDVAGWALRLGWGRTYLALRWMGEGEGVSVAVYGPGMDQAELADHPRVLALRAEAGR